MKPTEKEIMEAARLNSPDDLFEQVAFREGANFVLDQIGDGWISVEERLPEDKSIVLVWHKNTYGNFICTTSVYSIQYGFESCANISHWQPLPQKPRQ